MTKHPLRATSMLYVMDLIFVKNKKIKWRYYINNFIDSKKNKK